MKKGLTIVMLMMFISFAASAQRTVRVRPLRDNIQLTRPERMDLKRDAFRYEIMERRAKRDGSVSPYERRKLRRAKQEYRMDRFRYRHNNRRRLI